MISISQYNLLADQELWDQYVENHPQGTLYHLSGWGNVIRKTYGHKTYYLMAMREPENGSLLTPHSLKKAPSIAHQLSTNNNKINQRNKANQNAKLINNSTNMVAGVLQLVHMKHFLFGNSLISTPFFDLGGILADDEETEKALLSKAIKLGRELKLTNIELRHIQPPSCINSDDFQHRIQNCAFRTRSHKVCMLLDLPESAETLMKSFKSKLRSQIKKPLKEGLTAKIGSAELLNDFYKVFSINMRDLGSPVHSKKMIINVLNEFSDKAKIVIVYKESEPVACSVIVGFKNILENPWASALRQYSRLSPNMLLYWTMLEYACDNGFKYFDFGRSSPDEGTFKFKKQWGAKPKALHWHYIFLDGELVNKEISEKSKFNKAIQYWQKLPVPIANIFGPMIRKHIGL